MELMCSMCGQVKDETQFRFIKNGNRYYSYCRSCERLYIKEYMRIYRERKKTNGKDEKRISNLIKQCKVCRNRTYQTK